MRGDGRRACALEQLHHVERHALVLTAVEDFDDRRVAHGGKRLRLFQQSLGARSERMLDELHRDDAPEHRVTCAPHLPHPATADARVEPPPSCEQRSRVDGCGHRQSWMPYVGEGFVSLTRQWSQGCAARLCTRGRRRDLTGFLRIGFRLRWVARRFFAERESRNELLAR